MSPRALPLAHLFAIAAVAAFATLSTRAYAEEPDTNKQIAQQLFDEGRALLDANRYAEACPKFAESQRLDPGGGTILNLALCYELDGKTATAWAVFKEALGQAAKDGRKDRETLAREHLDVLGPKLVRVVVVVPPSLAEKRPEIQLDRSRLAEAAWGSAIPVDPGEHRVSASAPGFPPWTTTVTATQPGRTYTVDVRAVPAGGAAGAGGGGAEGPGAGGTAAAAPPVAAAEPGRRSTAFWLTLGGAGALAITSVVTGVVALDANAYVKDNCSAERDFCRVSDADEAASRATTFAWISTGTLVLAGAATAVAFILPRAPAPVGAARVDIGLGTIRITGM